MFTLFIFIAVLAVLVLAHEAGHFFVARKAGVRVDEFGFGFPPRLAGVWRDPKTKKFKWVGPKHLKKMSDGSYAGITSTIYSLNIIPLGGFVKIKGEDGEHKSEKDSFAAKKPWIRSAILSAGVLMNVAVAAVLLSIGFMIGIPAALGGELPAGAVITNQEVSVIEVLKDSPAAKGGVRSGDVVFSIEGVVPDDEDMAFKLISNYSHASELRLQVKRGEEVKNLLIVPEVIEEIGRPGIGVALIDTGLVSLPWYRAIPQGVIATGIFLWEILRAFGLIIRNVIAGAGVTDQLSGPVGIAVLTGQVARMGIQYLLQFTALLSLNLAIINILPIPALDGGRLLFVIIEKIRRGKTVSKKVEQYLHTTGFALLLLLVIIVTFRDVARFF